MRKEVNIEWKGDMAFNAQIGTHSIVLDATEDSGGHNLGPTPKPLILAALGGCTGMDVISILKKMRIVPDYFNVKTEAVMREEHPKRYTHIKVCYEFKGHNLELEKLQNAVNLSVDKYCGVIATLAPSVKMEYEIKILE